MCGRGQHWLLQVPISGPRAPLPGSLPYPGPSILHHLAGIFLKYKSNCEIEKLNFSKESGPVALSKLKLIATEPTRRPWSLGLQALPTWWPWTPNRFIWKILYFSQPFWTLLPLFSLPGMFSPYFYYLLDSAQALPPRKFSLTFTWFGCFPLLYLCLRFSCMNHLLKMGKCLNFLSLGCLIWKMGLILHSKFPYPASSRPKHADWCPQHTECP